MNLDANSDPKIEPQRKVSLKLWWPRHVTRWCNDL